MDLKKLAAMARLQRAADEDEPNQINEERTRETPDEEIYIPVEDETEPIPDDGYAVSSDYDEAETEELQEETVDSIIEKCFDEKAYNIEIERLLPFKKPIFEQSDDMSELKSDIARVGITEPLLVHSSGNGEYEILSGHRRRAAAEQLMWTKVPCRIGSNNDLTDEYTKRIVVETNRQRFPSLKLSEQIRVAAVLAHRAAGELNISAEQAEKLIKLNALEHEFLAMLDDGTINMMTAEILAGIQIDKQQIILTTLKQHPEMKITPTNAKELANEADLTAAAAVKILKPKPPIKIAVPSDVVSEYLYGKSPEELTEIVTAAIRNYYGGQHGKKV